LNQPLFPDRPIGGGSSTLPSLAPDLDSQSSHNSIPDSVPQTFYSNGISAVASGSQPTGPGMAGPQAGGSAIHNQYGQVLAYRTLEGCWSVGSDPRETQPRFDQTPDWEAEQWRWRRRLKKEGSRFSFSFSSVFDRASCVFRLTILGSVVPNTFPQKKIMCFLLFCIYFFRFVALLGFKVGKSLISYLKSVSFSFLFFSWICLTPLCMYVNHVFFLSFSFLFFFFFFLLPVQNQKNASCCARGFFFFFFFYEFLFLFCWQFSLLYIDVFTDGTLGEGVGSVPVS